MFQDLIKHLPPLNWDIMYYMVLPFNLFLATVVVPSLPRSCEALP